MFLRLRLLGLLVWTHSPPPCLWKNTKNRTGSELIRVPAGNRWSTQKDALEKELFKDMWEGLRADIKGWQIATDYYQWAVISVLRPERIKVSSLNPLSHVAVEEDQQRSEEGLHYRNLWTADKGNELGNNSLYLLLYACFTKYLSLANPSQKSNFSNLSWWISEQLYPHGYKAMAKRIKWESADGLRGGCQPSTGHIHSLCDQTPSLFRVSSVKWNSLEKT